MNKALLDCSVQSGGADDFTYRNAVQIGLERIFECEDVEIRIKIVDGLRIRVKECSQPVVILLFRSDKVIVSSCLLLACWKLSPP